MLLGGSTSGKVRIPLGELEHLPVLDFQFLSGRRILHSVELGEVATAHDADTCESRRNPRCADRRVRPARRPANDAELLDPEGIGSSTTSHGQASKVRPGVRLTPNPWSVDGEKSPGSSVFLLPKL